MLTHCTIRRAYSAIKAAFCKRQLFIELQYNTCGGKSQAKTHDNPEILAGFKYFLSNGYGETPALLLFSHRSFVYHAALSLLDMKSFSCKKSRRSRFGSGALHINL